MDFNPEQLTPAHLRAGRALLGWSAEALATNAGLGVATVRRAELGDLRVSFERRVAMVRALEGAGVVLTMREGEGPGAYLKERPSA